MKYGKNSLLVKSIFYNDLSILLSSFVVFLTISFILFTGQNEKLPAILEDSNKKIMVSYDHLLENVQMNLKNVVSEDFIIKKLEVIDLAVVANPHQTIVNQSTEEIFKNISTDSAFAKYLGSDIIGVSLFNNNGDILNEYFNPLKYKIGNNIYSVNKDILFFKNYSKSHKNYSYLDYVEETDELVLRTFITFEDEYKYIRHIMISTIIDNSFLEKIKEYVKLDEGIKLFLLYDGVFITGELNMQKGKNFFSSLGFVNNDKPNSEERMIHGDVYSISYAPVKDGQNQTIGLIGVAISKYSIFQFTFIEYVIAIIVILSLMVLISYVFGKVYERQFAPVKDITNCLKEISLGNYDTKLKVKAEGEFRELADVTKNLINHLNATQIILDKENKRLNEQIKRTSMIEKLLLNIHSEDNIDNIINYILSAITSEYGLNYGRAIYLEFDYEQEILKGKYSATNTRFVNSENEYFKFHTSLKLHSESLDKVVKLIKLDLDDNVIAESFKSKEIVFHNDRGFKFNLGSDLLTSLGLNNFILFPIFTQNKKYGIMIIDQNMNLKDFGYEDIELLNLLSMNISIHFKNKETEKERLHSEKDTTISYFSSKILREIQTPTELIKNTIKEFNENKYIDSEKMIKIDNSITKISHLSTAVLEYADINVYSFDKIDLKEVIDKSIENIKPLLTDKLIDLSKLYTHKKPVIANFNKMEIVVTEILKNAIEAIDKIGGRLNIATKNKSGGLQIKITDNGIGIDEKNMKKIFDPFFSSKGAPGLGLSIAKKILKEHSGEISIKSELNKGTEVRILLNIYEEE